MLVVYVPRVYLLFYPTQSYEVNLAKYLGQLMYTSGVISGIVCIIAHNLPNVAPCNV